MGQNAAHAEGAMGPAEVGVWPMTARDDHLEATVSEIIAGAMQDAAQGFARIGERFGWVLELPAAILLTAVVAAPLWVPMVMLWAMSPLVSILYLGFASWLILPALYAEDADE